MIVCVCEGLSERQLRARIDAGCATVGELGRACGAGRSCGACAVDLHKLLQRHRADRGQANPRPAAASASAERAA
ncbi:MAG: (2Fe-2S)-binding protein [Deltaproteobacteria bacterium]|nr:(2Fe-2S)-binding protein [Deltaproteobacteria bacterium]